ncbi:MAG: alpha-ketoacid dehydrogenase subunit beta [Thermoleophilia bacterium]|nr:alpha-ketoacid dehydrogenase subunit beta [Thermoleophilia bacterium]
MDVDVEGAEREAGATALAHGGERSLSYLQALNEALRQEMRRDDKVLVLGEDVAVGGALGILKGLAEEFGTERVRDTPISEAAFVGAAIGLAISGYRPVVDLMFSPFMWCAMDQCCNQAAKWRYMTGGQFSLPIVYRLATGQLGGEAAAQHAASIYSQFMQVPGLKIAVPSSPDDAKGLLKTAIRDLDPVLFFEVARLNGTKGPVPEDEDYLVPFGVARVFREGTDVTIVGIGYMVAEALRAAEMLEADGVSAEVIDPRTLVPLDVDTIVGSVRKTHRLVVADEATPAASAASEIVSCVVEQAIEWLDAHPTRVCALNVPTPFSPPLEKAALPDAERIVAAVHAQLARV